MSKDIFLATGVITEHVLFQNGLHQNSLLLYDLFESLGFRCHCLIDISSDFISGYRHIQPEDYLRDQSSYHPIVYIEIGLSLDADWRGYLQKKGCKTVKLYLGNVLNIDTETICMTPGLFFHHHVKGNFDAIWTSPHYKTGCAWLQALHGAPCSIVPYIWTPRFLSPLVKGPRSLSPLGDIVIAEPNISFQKTALIPLLLAEAVARQNPFWSGRVYIQNSERLLVTPFWLRIIEGLQLRKEGRIVFGKRKGIQELVQEHPDATFICHQNTNEYNYMTLELLWLNVRVLHNSTCWSSYGLYYSVDNWPNAIKTLIGGTGNEEGVASLFWSVSPENPYIQKRWLELLT